MKKIIDKKYLVFIGTIFVLGLLFGIIFLFLIDNVDKLSIKNEIISYVESIKNNNVILSSGFFNSFKTNFLYLFFIAIISVVFVFSIFTPFIIFYKGFSIGFLLGGFVYVYKIKGLFYSFIFMLPHEFINIITLFLFSYYSLKYSYKLYKVFKNKESINIRKFYSNYFIIFACFVFVMIISSLLEIFLNYQLIKLFI